MKPGIETCLTPELLHQFDLEGKVVVIIDVLRATTCMLAAFMKEVDHLVALADLEECREMKKCGYLIAGERNGEKIEGFDLGNSPLEYMEYDLKDKKIAITTTNGTQAINSSSMSEERIIASFLNKWAIGNYCISKGKSVVLICSGWKGRINLEDSLLAGALSEIMSSDFNFEDDTTRFVHSYYQKNRFNFLEEMNNASHTKRLSRLNQGGDLEFCVSEDLTEIVPFLEGNRIRV
jgi:2-phosphosulfolactate phosphatase